MRYLYIFATLFFTIYGQMIIKWSITKLHRSMPTKGLWDMVVSYAKFLFDPFIFSGFFSAFIASICWSMAMTKFQITEAYSLCVEGRGREDNCIANFQVLR